MKKIVIIAGLLLGVIIAEAQVNAPINSRQRAQRVRIAQGRQQGEITPGEAVLLNKQQRHIRNSECIAKADGVVTMHERRELQRKQHRANHAIHRARNNNMQKRG